MVAKVGVYLYKYWLQLMKEPCNCKVTSCISKEKKYYLVASKVKYRLGTFLSELLWDSVSPKIVSQIHYCPVFLFYSPSRGVKKRTPSSNGLIFSLPIGNYATPLTLLGLPFTILYGISPAFTTRACFIQVSRVWSWKRDDGIYFI